VTPHLQPLAELLAAHSLTGAAEEPLVHSGYSGAALSRLTRSDGERFVIKRMSLDRDWVMRSTADDACREACIAAAGVDLGTHVTTPNIGAARDGDGFALLMRDVTADLLPEGMISRKQLEQIITAVAALHHTKVPDDPIPWCALDRRMTLLTPAGGELAASYGAPVARDILDGWRAFDQHATPAARETIHALFADPSPLMRALGRLHAAFLHGDLKLDNVAIDPGGRECLIDRAMKLVAPPAGELGWFLAINSRRIPVSLDDAMDLYASAAGIPLSARPAHDALTVLCGLLLRGWRKGLDAETGEPAELRWWCERAESAATFLAG
jgi:aminoglycoside phosphotransferase (APT) family kinase protein